MLNGEAAHRLVIYRKSIFRHFFTAKPADVAGFGADYSPWA